ncbi:MAG: glucose-1-phosphate cytidylyltransferase [Nitrospira sp.]|nr:glucose-1-phosphate cytidylyltransferase [Nitrospira sp.]
MKVVLFCGGLGMRLREYSEHIPKPMVPIGYRPVLWHVMKYYAHFGHKEFILCLGHGADVIKNYFLDYNECGSNDFVLSQGGKKLDLISTDIHDWRITFADTGASSNIGQRLCAAEKYLGNDTVFLANYSDGLSDLPLDAHIEDFMRRDKIASCVTVPIPSSYHTVSSSPDGTVTDIHAIKSTNLRVNGGFFVLKRKIFDYIQPGEELVHEPFERLIKEQQLLAYAYDGFWACMDTFKDKQVLDEMYAKGRAPWMVWKSENSIP